MHMKKHQMKKNGNGNNVVRYLHEVQLVPEQSMKWAIRLSAVVFMYRYMGSCLFVP